MPAASERRARREMKTVGAMIALYCRGNHRTRHGLCPDCTELWTYAQQRVADCPLLADKPTCVNCPVHCYKPSMRETIKMVMRYSGPQMLWRHPVLTVFHLVDSRHDRRRPSLVGRPASLGRGKKVFPEGP